MVTYRVHRLPGEIMLALRKGDNVALLPMSPDDVADLIGELVDALRPVPECPSLAALIEQLPE